LTGFQEPTFIAPFRAPPGIWSGAIFVSAEIATRVGSGMYEYQVGDVIQCGTSIVRIHAIKSGRAWYHGTELGESSHGALTLGWCNLHGDSPILRRRAKPVSAENDLLYQQAVKLFPDQPWLRFPVRVSARLKHWLGDGCEQALETGTESTS
jgi:hypothetical protein